jgi:predicted ATPase/class 3 adenylate cyclase
MEFPSGTITMLFSDIEGSTVLVNRLGERYGEALSDQRAMLRTAFAECGGREVGTEGDSFFVVFESAADAIRCCVAAQRALASHTWPDAAAVRVRMGLHSGEPVRQDGSYLGLDVYRAARIAATAHGGQVVMSEATLLLARSQLPAQVSVRDLGWHRLRDIDAPERISQLVIADLQADFPPLKSLGALSSLPAPMTPLVGRGAALTQIQALVEVTGVRLLTLTGTGGVGKTRLALAAARVLEQAFEHGVYFVALAAVRDAEVMWKTIAGDLDAGGDGSAAEVTRFLQDRRALLVLDNLEQLDGAPGVVAALLDAAPRLVVLGTSRRPLHIRGEREYPVPPLELPRQATVPAMADVATSGAAQLFVQQAEMVRPGFALTPGNAADIATICRQLDGLPLAIELAASRAKLLSPTALLARLGDGLGLAATDKGRPSRQHTLRSTIAWSYDLLPDDLARVFRSLGVFAGGCDLEALAAVATTERAEQETVTGVRTAADPLELAAELLDVSLIRLTGGADAEPRIGMLETVREYALERLERADELGDTRRRHAEYYARVAEQARAQMGGPGHLAALNRLEAEHDNMRAALTWSLETRPDESADGADRAATGLRLAHSLGMFWYQHGHAAEGRQWLERAIDRADDGAGGAALAEATHSLGMLLRQQGDLDGAVRMLDRSLALWRGLGDREQEARTLNSLGIAYRHHGDLDAARSMFEASIAIARELGRPKVSVRLANLGNLEVEAGNLPRAAQVLREALALYQREGYPLGVANAQQALATVSLLSGRAAEARDLLSRTFEYVVSSRDPELLVNILEPSACVAAELGDLSRAARLAGAAAGIRDALGMPIPQPDMVLVERFLGPARATAPGESWATELAAGRALTRDEAVGLLLSADS